MPKKIPIVEKRRWLQDYEQGKSEAAIASQNHRDLRIIKKGIEEAHNLLRFDPFAELGEVAHVGEQHGQFAVLASETHIAMVALDLLQHRRMHIMAERAADLTPLAVGELRLVVNNGASDTRAKILSRPKDEL